MSLSRLIQHLRIRPRLLVGFAVVFVPMLLVGGVTTYWLVQRTITAQIQSELRNTTVALRDMVRTSIAVSIKNHLQAVAEKNREIAQFFHDQSAAGVISDALARQQAGRLLLSQRIGQTGHVYVVDGKGRIQVHPRQGLAGRNLAEYDFVRIRAAGRLGYLDYDWQSPSDRRPRPKAVFMAYFAPWNWVICAASYRDEFSGLVNVEDFRTNVREMVFGKTGYAYVMNGHGQMIIHPTAEGRNLYDATDTAGRYFVRRICREKAGQMTYTRQDAGDSAPRAKLVMFDYLPEFDWIVATTSYLDEIYAPLKKVRNLFAVIMLAVIGIGLAVSLFLATTITRPLAQLTKQLSASTSGDWKSRLKPVGRDEIARLASYFNRFMDQLETYSLELKDEIRERRRTEKALHESQLLFDAFMNHLPALAFIKDAEGRYLYLNEACRQMFGQPPERRIGRTDAALWEADVARRLMDNDARVMATGKVFSDMETVTVDGQVRYHMSTKFPILKDGRPAMIAGIAFDITDRIQAEEDKTRLEAQLAQSQKMEAIGTLAGGIAHDFNNILSAIFGYVEIAQFDVAPGTSVQQYLDQVMKAAQRARDLVSQILTFSRKTGQDAKPVDLEPLIKEALKLMRASLPTTIEIHTELDVPRSVIMADATRIHQVLMNLCTNAAHAMEDKGGRLTVALENRSVSSGQAPRMGLMPGDYIQLRVADTGHGMAPEVCERIFEPYFTTKVQGKGTGMGLSVVHGIVKSCGGSVSVKSRVGEGTTFVVMLPLAEDAQVEGKAHLDRLPTGTETILLVDDEKVLVDLGSQMLSRLGYTVVCRASSIDALEAVRNKPDRFDLVITDMTMPNMTGDVLARNILQIAARMPIILCTGYSERIGETEARQAGIAAFLMKPLTIGDLAHTVRKVLDGSRNGVIDG